MILSLLLSASPALAQQPDPILLDRLIALSMYEAAYARIIEASLDAPPEDRLGIEYHAGYVLILSEDWARVRTHFLPLPRTPSRSLAIAWSLYQEDNPRATLDVLRETEGSQARYLAGWVALSNQDPSEAVRQWQRVPENDPLHPDAFALTQQVASWERIPYRSPALAGTFAAVLPGAGHAYANHWGEALSSFLVNGGLIASSVALARRELWFGFGLVVLIESGFYGGNIISAIGRAKRFNRLAWEEPINQLADPYAPRIRFEDNQIRIR
ncbi:MAG: hypothetical protein AAFV53_31175 [Myxococcota bacterium]